MAAEKDAYSLIGMAFAGIALAGGKLLADSNNTAVRIVGCGLMFVGAVGLSGTAAAAMDDLGS